QAGGHLLPELSTEKCVVECQGEVICRVNNAFPDVEKLKVAANLMSRKFSVPFADWTLPSGSLPEASRCDPQGSVGHPATIPSPRRPTWWAKPGSTLSPRA